MVDPIDVHPELLQSLQRATHRGPVFTVLAKHRTSSGETLVGDVACYDAQGQPRALEQVALEVWSLFQEDADQHARPSKYWALFKGPSGEDRGRRGFTVDPTDTDLGTGHGESEAANSEGVTAQLMRQNEDYHRTLTEMTGLMLRHNRDELRRKDERISELEGRELHVVDAYRDLTMDLEGRNAARRKEQREDEFKERLFSKVELLLPVLVHRAIGTKTTDMGGDVLEDVAMLRRSLEMRPAAFPRIMACLSNEQMIAAHELITGKPGPMTGELIRKFMGSLDDPKRGGIEGQLAKLADGVLTGDEFKLLSKIYNEVADWERREAAKKGPEPKAVDPSPNVRALVEDSGKEERKSA